MPAGSDRLPVALPHTFRPLGVRLAAYAFGGMLVVVCIVMWFAFPPAVRAQFTVVQLGTIIALGLAAAACGHALARCRVDARSDGVTVVNGFKVRRLDWNEILAISLRQGSPWAMLDLSDGSTVPAMGIQGSDGSRAVAQVKALRAMLDQQSRTDRND